MAGRLLESQGMHFERAELDSPLLVSRLLQQCETAKCALSRQESAAVRFPDKQGELNDDSPRFAVPRDKFNQWCESLIARIELPIRRTLGDARLKAADIHDVILVGGATRMPMLVERVRQLFGREPRCHLNPDEVVGLGAAVQAGLVARDESVGDLVVTDVAPFTLGIAISKHLGMEHRDGYFLPVLNRNVTIPASRVERVSTIQPNQTKVTVRVYQGENRRVENNLPLGEFDVDGIPRGPAGQSVDVRFTYDLNPGTKSCISSPGTRAD
jgi:molecular chaperone HscC